MATTPELDLRERVMEALRWERDVDAKRLRVEVRGGYVRLMGQVDSPEERAAAEWAAQRVEGVVGVDSEILVVPPIPDIVA